MRSTHNRTILAARAAKAERGIHPNVAVLTMGPLGANLVARVETSAPRVGFVSRKNKAPKITAGQQRHWDRPSAIGGTVGLVMNDKRWSRTVSDKD